ncbi:MAG: phosphotransferase family protein [Sarcina sp.]
MESNLFKELSDEELQNILSEYFKKEVVFEAKLLSEGGFNTVYYICVDKNIELILRVEPINKELIFDFEQNLMESEVLFYDECKKYNIQCSNVLKVDTSKSIIDRDYMIVEFIKSKALIHYDNKDEDVYEELGKLIKKVHEIKGEKFGRIRDVKYGNGFELWSEFLESEMNEALDKCLKLNLLDELEIRKYREVIGRYEEMLDEITDKSLVHADFWIGNVLVSKVDGKVKVAAIIDGDRALYGDSEFDFRGEWITEKAFYIGYGNTEEIDKKVKIRRLIYMLIHTIRSIYIWKAEYNNDDMSEKEVINARGIFEKLKKILIIK